MHVRKIENSVPTIENAFYTKKEPGFPDSFFIFLLTIYHWNILYHGIFRCILRRNTQLRFVNHWIFSFFLWLYTYQTNLWKWPIITFKYLFLFSTIPKNSGIRK